jgi:peptidoglycan/LPS O-acetylase OafA/YrhL
MNQDKRYKQLDALRGLAAFTVVLSHFALLTPPAFLRHLPWRMLCGGREAVILFFTLSGFVLALQIYGTRRLSFGEFVIRRICRIYLPYVAAVAFAYVCYTYCYRGDVPWAGEWFNLLWPSSLANVSLAQHLLFVLPFETYHLDPIIWSLVYEMRISLLFMPIVFFVFSVPAWQALGAAASLSIAACIYAAQTNHPLLQASGDAEWLPTLHYLLMFVTGAVLARHRDAIASWLSSKRGAAWLLPAGSLVLYEVAGRLAILSSAVARVYLFDWLIMLSVCGIIASAFALPRFARLLELPPLPFLGKISYSLYLYHAIVLFAVVHLVGNRLGAPLTLAIVAVLIVPVSYVGYVLVEHPGMRLGSRLSRKLVARAMPRNVAASE